MGRRPCAAPIRWREARRRLIRGSERPPFARGGSPRAACSESSTELDVRVYDDFSEPLLGAGGGQSAWCPLRVRVTGCWFPGRERRYPHVGVAELAAGRVVGTGCVPCRAMPGVVWLHPGGQQAAVGGLLGAA